MKKENQPEQEKRKKSRDKVKITKQDIRNCNARRRLEALRDLKDLDWYENL